MGAFTGWGGLIYCFAHLAALWGDETLREEARRIAERTIEFAGSDSYLDVTAGVAGFALALRSLDQMEKPARVGGERLLSTLTRTRYGAGWFREEISGQPLTGFAHGNAGIGYALLEIAATTEKVSSLWRPATRLNMSEPCFQQSIVTGQTCAKIAPQTTWWHGAMERPASGFRA